MLINILMTPISLQKIGARDHVALASMNIEQVDRIIARDKSTCHVCGTRVTGCMEVDHLVRHGKSSDAELRAICHFCHALKHPLWAASVRKFVPIYAPDLTQTDLMRLAWLVFARRNDPELKIDTKAIEASVRDRRKMFSEVMIGTDSKTREGDQLTYGPEACEALFEAVLGMKTLRGATLETLKGALSPIEGFLRFWPAELLDDKDGIGRGGLFSRWGVGGFQTVADEMSTAIRADMTKVAARVIARRNAAGISEEGGAAVTDEDGSDGTQIS